MPLTLRRKVDIVTDYLDRIGALDFDGAARYLADDAVMMVPFAPSGVELPPLAGKQKILDQMRATMVRLFVRMQFTVDAWYDVANSEVLIAEYHSVCPLKGGAGEYRNSYVGVFRFDHEKIALHKEYFDPTRLAALARADNNEKA